MRFRPWPSVLAVMFVLAVFPALAADGAIPIWEPTTITEPGRYILTRDIEVSSGTAILVDADDVTLDLNGFTVTSTVTDNYLIVLSPDKDGFLVKNGTLRGGQDGIRSLGLNNVSRIRIHELTISEQQSSGIYLLSPRYVEVIGCMVGPTTAAHAVFVSGSPGFEGRFIDNHIIDPGDVGLYISFIQNGEVVGNIVKRHDEEDAGIAIVNCGGTRVEGNVVSTTISNGHEGMRLYCDNSIVTGNIVRGSGFSGIVVDGYGNRITENDLNYNRGSGIWVSGRHNDLDRNSCQGNDEYGIFFVSSNEHAYRNNMLRGNAGGPVGGSANTDAGGNIF